MKIDLSGRTALVTGAGSGIGRAIAIGLHRAGAMVIVNDRDAEAVAATVECLGDDERHRGIVVDVGTAEGCNTLALEAPVVDILVNNVGVASPMPVFEIADQQWAQVFAVNVMSAIRMARACIPGMVDRGWGRAIFVASESGLQIPPEMVHYGVSKAAILAAARGFAEAVARTGVTVNSVVPGPTRTAGSEAFMQGMSADGDTTELDVLERRYLVRDRPSSLLGRFTMPEEIANLVVYLASDLASATTGAAMRADGGVVRSIG